MHTEPHKISRLMVNWLGVPTAAALLLSGCTGFSTDSERQAQARLTALSGKYRPGDRKATLPALGPSSPLQAFLRFAMLNQPRVEAAYYDYAVAVEGITVERSLPDPRLTFELDIQDVLTTVMPGIMTDVPWTSKLRIRADKASAESEAKLFAFAAAVLQAAFDLKRPYYQLHFLDERIRINRETLALMGELEQIARAQTEAGKVTLQDVLRTQIEQERLRVEIANLEDSRNPLLAKFKAALGLHGGQPNPPFPQRFESTPLDLTSERLFAKALAVNPRLKQMEAEIRMAEADIRLAHQSKSPDFNGGLEVDVKMSPAVWRPTFGITLPIWRDKIAAEIAAAQARKSAAHARLSAEQIQLAVEFADKSFMFREASRNQKLLTDSLLPKARQALEVARSGYSAGKTDFINLQEAARARLEFELAATDAGVNRELALAEVSLVIVGIAPSGTPMLKPSEVAAPNSIQPAKGRPSRH
ncbi:MAG: TolC family protein [Verrucomicrobia bacterium]|nr:TolC family protein [Verrucomicrobiota bacterium]